MTGEDGKQVILVVDDVPENVEVLAGALDGEYEVRIALNGEEALAAATSPPAPDLILLDVMMPGMDGYEVCRRLKAAERTREIPVVFVTAMDEMEDEQRGFEMGGVDYITKPIRTPIVLARVRAHLELRRAREDLKDQNRVLAENLRLRDDVESIVRHDIRTPVSVFLWAPRILAAGGDLTSGQMDTIKVMEQAARSILEVLSRSVDLIKMERGEYHLNPSDVDLVEVLRQVGADLHGLARTKGLTFEITVGGRPAKEAGPFIVSGEEILLYSMLANLAKNAMEASPDGGTVSVALDDDERRNVTIHNAGAVPPGIREHFFDKYVSSDKRVGTGLGTYSARLMAEAQGGRIRMQSSENEGTTVVISFPQSEGSQE